MVEVEQKVVEDGEWTKMAWMEQKKEHSVAVVAAAVAGAVVVAVVGSLQVLDLHVDYLPEAPK